MEKQRLPVPRFERVVNVAKVVGHVLSGPHTFATHGDHFVSQNPDMIPFEAIVEVLPPRYDSRGYPQYDDMGCYFEGDVEAIRNELRADPTE